MKRIIIVLISLLAIGSLFASQLYEEGNIGEGALLSSSIEYYLDFSDLSSMDFGFSENYVDNDLPPNVRTTLPLDTNITRDAENKPTSLFGTGTCYAYWDIVTTSTNVKVMINLSGPMTYGDSYTLDWKCDIYEGAKEDSRHLGTIGRIDGENGSYGELSLEPEAVTDLEKIGSRRLEFTTANALGKPAVTFGGTVSLIVEIN